MEKVLEIRNEEDLNRAMNMFLRTMREQRMQQHKAECACRRPQHQEDEGYSIIDVIYSNPATIIKWSDGTKTVVKCQNGEPFDREKGFAMAFMKKACGNTGNYNDLLHEWCDEPAEAEKEVETPQVQDVKEVENAVKDLSEVIE